MWENAYLSIKNPKASRALKWALNPGCKLLASLTQLHFAMSATFGLRTWSPLLDQILDPHLLPGGVSAPKGFCSWGVSVPGWRVSAPGVGVGCLLLGVSAPPGGLFLGGVCSHWGLLSRGVYSRGCLFWGEGSATPPLREQNDRQVKTLPCRNFVAGGKNIGFY